MGVHDGHRDRLRKRFQTQGLSGFEDHNVLELLLFYARSQIDTNVIAHALLDRFRSLDAVFDAPYEELIKVEGVGPTTATLITLMPQLFKRYRISQNSDLEVLDTTEKRGQFLLPYYLGERHEVFYLLTLDRRDKLLFCDRVFEGSVAAVQILTRRVLETLILRNAVRVIVAHQHPSGIALPSRDDLNTTMQLQESLRHASVELLDHIILAGDDFISMRESGYLR